MHIVLSDLSNQQDWTCASSQILKLSSLKKKIESLWNLETKDPFIVSDSVGMFYYAVCLLVYCGTIPCDHDFSESRCTSKDFGIPNSGTSSHVKRSLTDKGNTRETHSATSAEQSQYQSEQCASIYLHPTL